MLLPRGGSGHGSSGRTKNHIYTDRPKNGPSSDGDGVVAQKTTSSPEVASASLLELELEGVDLKNFSPMKHPRHENDLYCRPIWSMG